MDNVTLVMYPDDWNTTEEVVSGFNMSEMAAFLQVAQTQIRITIITFYLLTFVCGCVGNLLVIYIIGHFVKERVKSVSNYYIWSLSFADLLFVLSLPLFCWATFVGHWPFAGDFGDISCKIAYACRDVTKFASAWIMVALSIDRCLASFYHLGHLRTIRAGKLVIVVIWVGCCVGSSHYFYFAKTIDGSCKLQQHTYGWVWTILQLTFGFILPSLGIFTAYCILWSRINRRMLNRQSSNQSHHSGSSRRMTRTVFVVVVAFTVCQTPYHAIQIAQLTSGVGPHNLKVFVYANAVAQILVFVSSCCNPIIYGLLNANFRRLYEAALCRCAPSCPFCCAGYRVTRHNRSRSVEQTRLTEF